MGLKEPVDEEHAFSWGLPIDHEHVLYDGIERTAFGNIPDRFGLYSGGNIPHRQPRSISAPSIASPSSTPRKLRLFQLLLAAAIVGMVLVQAFSCGLFFCVRLPTGAHYVDLRDLFTDFTLPRDAAGTKAVADATSIPKLIPRIIHQTYASKNVPDAVKPVMQSWQLNNPGSGWQMRFYDDAACLEFVTREFPEYLHAYNALAKNVERSDFFRYMIILRMGGVYADVDVECRQPLDPLIRATDTLLVGWESEVSDDAQTFKRHFVRNRQVLQWFFAASPGHPVLRDLCNHIANNLHTRFSNNSNRDTLDRTGPGAFTDAVLRHASKHTAAVQAVNPWNVRILPRVAFGVHPAGIDGLTPDAKEIVVLHHFLGSWKSKGGWRKHRSLWQAISELISKVRRDKALPPAEEPIRASVVTHFPVSAAFEPPFSVLVDLIGHGDRQGGADVSALLSSWGNFQAGLHPSRHPSVVEALVGSLGPRAGGGTLVDVGAGQGFFSLAAAARGHRAIAFEASSLSLASFRASVAYNGFDHLVELRNVSLGAAAGTYCAAARGGDAVDVSDAAVDLRRGYGDAAAHRAADCATFAPRRTLSEMLSSEEAADVGALRISAAGWEALVLDGAADFLSHHRPGLILLEYSPALMPRAGDRRDPSALLHHLYSLGYVNAAHAGYVCDERWQNITKALGVGKPAVAGAAAAAVAGQPVSQSTWCNLKPEHFHLIGERAHDEVPENIMFIHDSHHDVAGEVPLSGANAVKGAAAAAAVAAAAATGDASRQVAAAHGSLSPAAAVSNIVASDAASAAEVASGGAHSSNSATLASDVAMRRSSVAGSSAAAAAAATAAATASTESTAAASATAGSAGQGTARFRGMG